jgi:hypothetical protein
MEICTWAETNTDCTGTMVRVNKEEALRLIKSLSSQLISDDIWDSGREEFQTDNGQYFSISVVNSTSHSSQSEKSGG